MSNRTQLALTLLPQTLGVCRLPADAPLPQWAQGSFCSITRTAGELSIVCEQARIPQGVQCQSDFRALAVNGTLDFSLVGILSMLLAPLKAAGISVFVLSTFDTDIILVSQSRLSDAVYALEAEGFVVCQAHEEGENPAE